MFVPEMVAVFVELLQQPNCEVILDFLYDIVRYKQGKLLNNKRIRDIKKLGI
jgi:hypothetical protein